MTHIIFLFSLFFSWPALNKKLPFYIFSFCTLLLFLVLRYDYGNDYMSYYTIHSALNAGNEAWGQNDILFKYLNLSVPNYYWMITIISLFYVFTMYYLIKSNLNVKHYWFALLLLLINPYLFLIHLSTIRQTIAICFVIFAVFFAVKRKLLIYLVFIVIASEFHKSALIVLPVYFFLNDSKINKKMFIAIYGLLAFLLFTQLFDTILNWVLDYFPSYGSYVQESLQNSHLRTILISSFLFFLVIFNINKLEGIEIIYGKLALISTIISLLATKLIMISRFGMYFDIFLIIAIPLIISRLRVKANKQILSIIVITIYLLRYVSFFNNPTFHEYYHTYRTILEI